MVELNFQSNTDFSIKEQKMEKIKCKTAIYMSKPFYRQRINLKIDAIVAVLYAFLHRLICYFFFGQSFSF